MLSTPGVGFIEAGQARARKPATRPGRRPWRAAATQHGPRLTWVRDGIAARADPCAIRTTNIGTGALHEAPSARPRHRPPACARRLRPRQPQRHARHARCRQGRRGQQHARRLRPAAGRAHQRHPHQPAPGAAGHRPHRAGQGGGEPGSEGSGHGNVRRRHLHLLDLRRHGAGQLHPRAPGRHGGVPPQQPPRFEDAAQHRPARRHRPRRRRGLQLHRAGPQLAVHLQGAQRRPVRLPLRHRAGGHARGQRHVRPDPGRAAGRPAGGGQGVLRDAGRLLHHQQVPRERPRAVRHAARHRREPHLRPLQRLGRRAHRRQRAAGQRG